MSTDNIIKTNCAVIVLAAGGSSRLGRPKQLLPFRGKSLLEHAVDSANDSAASPVIVVLGSNAKELEMYIDEKKLHIVENDAWHKGIGVSIRCGMETLKRVALLSDAVILMVCDQPYVSAELLDALIKKQQETGKAIVACSYGNTIGTPALFFKSMFSNLLRLNADSGAKILIEKHTEELAVVNFPSGEIDVDTEEDYRQLGSHS